MVRKEKIKHLVYAHYNLSFYTGLNELNPIGVDADSLSAETKAGLSNPISTDFAFQNKKTNVLVSNSRKDPEINSG